MGDVQRCARMPSIACAAGELREKPNASPINKYKIFFIVSRSLPIKRGGHAGSHTASVGIINAPLKLVNAKLLSLFSYFCRKVNGDVHFYSDFIVLPLRSELLYQSDTSFFDFILRSGLSIIQK